MDTSVLMSRWMNEKATATKITYEASLAVFAKWMGIADHSEAIERLIRRGSLHAEHTLVEYQADMLREGLRPNTVNGRVGMLVSILLYAKDTGAIDWVIRVRQLPLDGEISKEGLRGKLARIDPKLVKRDDKKGIRDRALFSIAQLPGIRRGEIVGLDIDDVNLAENIILVGKGKRHTRWLRLPVDTAAYIEEWLQCRKDDVAALFLGMSNHGGGERISGSGVWKVITRQAKITTITAKR